MLIVYAPIIVAFLDVLVLRDFGTSTGLLSEPPLRYMGGTSSGRALTVARARDPPVKLLV